MRAGEETAEQPAVVGLVVDRPGPRSLWHPLVVLPELVWMLALVFGYSLARLFVVDPARGHRFDGSRVLADPYAKLISGNTGNSLLPPLGQVKSHSDLGLPRRRNSLHILKLPELIDHPRTITSNR